MEIIWGNLRGVSGSAEAEGNSNAEVSKELRFIKCPRCFLKSGNILTVFRLTHLFDMISGGLETRPLNTSPDTTAQNVGFSGCYTQLILEGGHVR